MTYFLKKALNFDVNIISITFVESFNTCIVSLEPVLSLDIKPEFSCQTPFFAAYHKNFFGFYFTWLIPIKELNKISFCNVKVDHTTGAGNFF